jgi:hypothetical protein
MTALLGVHILLVQKTLSINTPSDASLSIFGVGAIFANLDPYALTALVVWSSDIIKRMFGFLLLSSSNLVAVLQPTGTIVSSPMIINLCCSLMMVNKFLS